MDNGGYKFVMDLEPYLVSDESDYFAIYLHYKQVAAFKNKKDAFEYVLWKVSK